MRKNIQNRDTFLQRAKDAGVEEETLEDVLDVDDLGDSKAAMVALILAAATSSSAGDATSAHGVWDKSFLRQFIINGRFARTGSGQT